MKSTVSEQSGVALIEVLIAVLVLAIGLLGFVGLQTQAIKMNYDSLQRARASMLAEDLFDRMRGNRNEALTTTKYIHDVGDAAPTPDVDCATATCTGAELADWDLNVWLTRLTDRAPGATASVQRVGGVSNHYLVTITLVELSEAEIALSQVDESSSTFDDDLSAEQSISFQFETVL